MKLAWSVAIWCALGFTVWWSQARARERARAVALPVRRPRSVDRSGARGPGGHDSEAGEAEALASTPATPPASRSVDVLMDD